MNKQILKEMKRWLLNHRELTLHQRINVREIMGGDHYMILGLNVPPKSKRIKGESKLFAMIQIRNRDIPNWLRKKWAEYYKLNK